MLTEFANSIANRTSILQKGFLSCDEKANTVSDADHGKRPDEDQSQDPQAKCERTLEADKLPTGDYLGDVEVSRFIDIYRWMNAANPSLGTGAYRRDDRIAAIRSLTEDYYWEKVNEVYASGQGDVSMAFIKDELGNWNLKSYTNDPAKLLAAYRQGANALIASAVDVARKASGDPVNLAKGAGLLDLADRFATGKSRQGPAMGGLNVAALHTRTLERLTALRSRFKERADQLEQLKISLTNRATIAETDWGAAVAARQSAESEEAAAKAALAACTAGCATETTRLADALAATQANRTVVAAAESKLRDERAKLAVATAQADQLGSLAAEEVARVLEEHQGDLAAVQVSITSPPGPGAPKP